MAQKLYPGTQRRRLTEADKPIADELTVVGIRVNEAEQILEAARAARWKVVSKAFKTGIHPLDVMRLTGVERRTVRDWHARWVNETTERSSV